jgi:RNA polymerase sigma-70 factor (ECF subfamily)
MFALNFESACNLSLAQEKKAQPEANLWLEGIVAKNETALERLIAIYEEPLYKAALAYLADKSSAEDAVQNTFITLWQQAHKINKSSALRSWLFATLFNQCRKHIRTLINRQKRELKFAESKSLESSPNTEEKQDSNIALLQSALDKLKDPQKQLIILKFYEKMSIAEISEVMGLKEGTCKSRLHRAIAKLKTLMEVKR